MKRYLVTNLTTMIMALFLSFLTWFYLFTQGNGPAEIDVQFLPKIDSKDFASVTWQDAEGRELTPEGSLHVRVLGPKVDVNSLRLRPNDFTCKLSVNPKELAGSRGIFRRPLVREDFNLPPNIIVDPLPVVAIGYVRFDERTIELTADRTSFEGTLRRGYEIESITPTPRRIKARVPADRAEPLQKQVVLPIEHGDEPFFRHITRPCAIDLVADFFVVRGDGLGDRARRRTYTEEPAGHLLACANFRKCAVNRAVEVQGQGLAVGIALNRHCF